MNSLADALPNSVRYVKNGEGGKWWKAAKAHGQVHAGWRIVPPDLLRAADMTAIEPLIRSHFGAKRGATQDFNALRTLVDHPSRHLWVTFEDGCMWWCTVRDGIEVNPDGDMSNQEHFWLTCALPWSDHSVGGLRQLATRDLPGAAAAGFKGAVCEPKAWREILRVILIEARCSISCRLIRHLASLNAIRGTSGVREASGAYFV